MLVFEERGKPEYPEKNLSEQRRETTTNSTHIWMASTRGFKRGPHWWEASGLTTAPPSQPLSLVMKESQAVADVPINWVLSGEDEAWRSSLPLLRLRPTRPSANPFLVSKMAFHSNPQFHSKSLLNCCIDEYLACKWKALRLVCILNCLHGFLREQCTFISG